MVNFDIGKSLREIYFKSYYNYDKVKYEVVDIYLYGFFCCIVYILLLNLRVFFFFLSECFFVNEIIILLVR